MSLERTVYFALDWDVNDHESEENNFDGDVDGYFHAIKFHRNNCLKIEAIYDHYRAHVDESGSNYFSEIDMMNKLIKGTKGIAVISARKINGCTLTNQQKN